MALDIDGIPCPFCGKAAVATFDADLPDVTSFGVVGGLQWGCPSCGRGGTLEYTAYYGHAAFFDDRGDKIGEVERMDAYVRTRALAGATGPSPVADAMRLVGDFVAHQEYDELLMTYHHVMRCLRAIRTHRTSGNTMAENVEDMRYVLGEWSDAAWEMRDSVIIARRSFNPMAVFTHWDVLDDLRGKYCFMVRVLDLCYGYVAAIEERLDWCPDPSEEEEWFGWTTYVPEEAD